MYYAMIALLALAFASWLLISPLRSWSEDGSSWWAAGLEAASIAIFVGSIEGLLFSLVPLDFVEGRKLWLYNRFAWLTIALFVTFVFFHVVLGLEESLDSLATVRFFLVAMVLFGLACSAWLFFRLRRGLRPNDASVQP